jgi:hypothetical protein
MTRLALRFQTFMEKDGRRSLQRCICYGIPRSRLDARLLDRCYAAAAREHMLELHSDSIELRNLALIGLYHQYSCYPAK